MPTQNWVSSDMFFILNVCRCVYYIRFFVFLFVMTHICAFVILISILADIALINILSFFLQTFNFCVSATEADICSLPLVKGPCEALGFPWGFDNRLNKCRKFEYGGCDGNKNRFRYVCRTDELENGRKMLENFNKIYSFLDFFDRYISRLNAEKTSLRLFVAGQPSCQPNHFLYPGKGYDWKNTVYGCSWYTITVSTTFTLCCIA